jgi:hypothetical protein
MDRQVLIQQQSSLPAAKGTMKIDLGIAGGSVPPEDMKRLGITFFFFHSTAEYDGDSLACSTRSVVGAKLFYLCFV